MIDGELLTVIEAANLLNCGPDGVRYLHKVRKLEAVRTPRGVRLFQRSDVERLAKERNEKRNKKY